MKTMVALLTVLVAGCGGNLSTPDAGSTPAPPAAADAGFAFAYCNTDNPKNQTKFLAVDVGDGGCAASYEVSFGTDTFSCSCAEPGACQAAYDRLRAQAADCPSVPQ